MRKFLLYRNLPEGADIGQRPELIAVEVGNDIISVTDDLMDSIRTDLSETAEYRGSYHEIHAPELEYTDPVTGKCEYSMTAVILPVSAFRNPFIRYTVIEDDTSPSKIVDAPSPWKQLN